MNKNLRNSFLISQDKSWIRKLESIVPFLSFLMSLSILLDYYLNSTNDPQPYSRLAWLSLFSSIPIFFLIYRESNLLKIERLALVIFIAASSLFLMGAT